MSGEEKVSKKFRCEKDKCEQSPRFALSSRRKIKVACADHVEDLRTEVDAVYRVNPETGRIGELVRAADKEPQDGEKAKAKDL